MNGNPVVAAQKTDLVHVIVDGEIMIDAPPSDVWKAVVDYPSWQNFSIREHVSGTKGGEGETVRLKKDEPGASITAYYARTVRIWPGERIIWKTFRDNSNYFGIVDFRLEPVGQTTRFTWNCIYEYSMAYEDPSELEAFRRKQTADFELAGRHIYPKLKALAEGRR